MQIDSHLLKISASSIYIDQPLELGSEVDIVVRGSVVKIEDKDNQDSTCNRVYVVKGEIALPVKEENDNR